MNVIESNEGWNISVGTDEIEEESDGKFVGAGGITSGNGYAYLNMDNCCVRQGNYNLCWAASIATIYRYRTGNRSLTAKNVADKVGLPYAAATEKYKIIKYSENACYSSGSNIFMIQSGFSYK